MDKETLETNINAIKEMVLDEQRLVTYGSLSKDLCIHVNDSKKLLFNFVDNLKKKQPDFALNVNYIISGISKNNKARTTVCSDKEIDTVRDSLKMIFFEHIYSVSKGVAAVDNVALLAISKFEDLHFCTGLIKSSACVKRSADEIGNLKSSSQVVQPEKKPIHPPSKKVKEENNVVKKDEQSKSIVKVHETKSEPTIKSEVPSPKKESSSTKTKTDNKKNGVKTQKGIAGFFGKSNSAPSKVLTKNDDKPITVKKEKDSLQGKTDEMDVDVEVNTPIKEVNQKELKPEAKNENINSKQKNKTNDKLNQIKKNAKVDKKRKRVLHVSDSESEDEKDPFVDDSEQQENNMSDDDEIPPTPTVNTVKITSGIVNPRKRRKIVDKTYTDEDGYILTKKEEVYESCSDNEEEVSVKENIKVQTSNKIKQETSPNKKNGPKQEISPKKNGPKNSKKKISPPQKGKQATMMNFFKKV